MAFVVKVKLRLPRIPNFPFSYLIITTSTAKEHSAELKLPGLSPNHSQDRATTPTTGNPPSLTASVMINAPAAARRTKKYTCRLRHTISIIPTYPPLNEQTIFLRLFTVDTNCATDPLLLFRFSSHPDTPRDRRSSAIIKFEAPENPARDLRLLASDGTTRRLKNSRSGQGRTTQKLPKANGGNNCNGCRQHMGHQCPTRHPPRTDPPTPPRPHPTPLQHPPHDLQLLHPQHAARVSAPPTAPPAHNGPLRTHPTRLARLCLLRLRTSDSLPRIPDPDLGAADHKLLYAPRVPRRAVDASRSGAHGCLAEGTRGRGS
ncbi:hypothetical protein HD806DRAFT_316342 [Xylariaceae sp. AK1471]|nr:hypothetical protein HD806DRAFT_316342 [Xylariaceae sp. AK1471]